jgi:hypothetical protein
MTLPIIGKFINRANIMTLIVVVILAGALVVGWKVWSENKDNFIFCMQKKEWCDITRNDYHDHVNILK